MIIGGAKQKCLGAATKFESSTYNIIKETPTNSMSLAQFVGT
jgi:hypothetical protein